MEKIAVIGCGNWGTAIANIVAQNVENREGYDSCVLMYTHLQTLNYKGKEMLLKDVINHFHVNPPFSSHVLNKNIKSVGDYEEINNSSVLIICIPSQFLDSLQGINFNKKRVINLSKGLIYKNETIATPSEYISTKFTTKVSSLQGANLADEVADGKYTETVIGVHTDEDRIIYSDIFNTKAFKCIFIPYNPIIEVFGGLKNIVALAYGILEGLGNRLKIGNNTNSTIFTQGLIEMRRICEHFNYSGFEELIFTSCGVGDLLTTCLSGRNYKAGIKLGNGETIQDEYQKTQGMETIVNIYTNFSHNPVDFKLMTMVHQVVNGKDPQEALIEFMER